MIFHRVFPRLSWRKVIEAADLFCMSCLVLAQPVLNVLAKNPEFFPIRRLGGADIILLVFVLCFAIPAVLHGLLWALGAWRGRGAALRARAAIVGIFAGLFLLQTIHDLGRVGGAPKSALALAFAVAFGVLYFRFQAPKTFVAALAPAIAIIPVTFLLFSPVRSLLISPRPPSPPSQAQGVSTPIVMLVFDGLSTVALLGKDGSVDSTLFPNFASLARQSTWYRNVWSKWDRTERAAPAILTGRFPDPPKPPTYASQPENLFTYLGDRYEMHVQERITSLCPEHLCSPHPSSASHPGRLASLLIDSAVVFAHRTLPAEWSRALPPIHRKWEFFAEDLISTSHDQRPHQQVDRFLGKLRDTSRPTLWYLHIEPPHPPLRYLPSGRVYGPVGRVLGDELTEVNPTTGYLRYLLTVGYVDRELGRILKKLKAENLFDKSLIVVTSDHGVPWIPDGPKKNSAAILTNLLAVPFFAKQPFQREGTIIENAMETTDIFPTIAELLGSPLPWRVGEHPVAGAARLPAHLPEGGIRIALKEKMKMFGSGHSRFDDLFYVDDRWGLVGKMVSLVDVEKSDGYRVRLDHPELFDAVSTDGHFVPARITGLLFTPASAPRNLSLAVAVNGVIRSIALTPGQDNPAWFSAMVPESSFRPGRNEVSILVIKSDGSGLLAPKGQVGKEFELRDGILVGGGRELRTVRNAFNGRISLEQVEDSVVGRGQFPTQGSAPPARLLVFSNGGLMADIMPSHAPSTTGNGRVLPGERKKWERHRHEIEKLTQVKFHFSFPWAPSSKTALKKFRFFGLSDEGVASEIEWRFGEG